MTVRLEPEPTYVVRLKPDTTYIRLKPGRYFATAAAFSTASHGSPVRPK